MTILPFAVIYKTKSGSTRPEYSGHTIEDCEAWIEAHSAEFPDNSLRVTEVDCPEEEE